MKNTKFCVSTVVLSLLLALLVIVFRTEILVLGVRLSTIVHDTPRAERFLGDYYANAAEQNLLLANQFYAKGLNDIVKRLETATPDQKAVYFMAKGRYFECGKGVNADLIQAQNLYQQAVKAAKAQGQDATVFQKGLDRINQAIKAKAISVTCVIEDENY